MPKIKLNEKSDLVFAIFSFYFLFYEKQKGTEETLETQGTLETLETKHLSCL